MNALIKVEAVYRRGEKDKGFLVVEEGNMVYYDRADFIQLVSDGKVHKIEVVNHGKALNNKRLRVIGGNVSSFRDMTKAEIDNYINGGGNK